MNEKVILKGVVGSHAYGLNHAHSDVDYAGIFVHPTETILSIFPYAETYSSTGSDDKDAAPDTALHEVKKFITLAAAANPTVLEFLFLDDYTISTSEGKMLVGIRDEFLSTKIRKTHIGYAKGQIDRFFRGVDPRTDKVKPDSRKRSEKNARHTIRLILQGFHALENGTLSPRLSPEDVREVQEQAEIAVNEPRRFIRYTDQFFRAIEEMDTTLPDEPNWDAINETLLRIRKMN